MRLRLNQRRYSDAEIVFFIFMFGIIFRTALHFTVFNFSRAIRLGDEMRYYDLARSFFMGDGLSMRGISTLFQKIGYPLFLMPFFALGNIELSLKVIGVVQIIIMNASVIFMWLMCSELGLGRRTKCFIAFLTVVFPDMMYSMTYMSEALYWPLTVIFFWLWLLNERRQSFIIAVCEGLLCYFMYLTKEVSLAFVISYAAYTVIYPFLKIDGDPGRKKRIKLFGAFLAAFALCYVAMKLTLFRGMGNSYNQMSIDAIMSPYKFMYLFYGFFYYIAALIIASLVFPCVYPFVNFRHMSISGRKLFCYVVLTGLAITATIAYTIIVREQLGRINPTIFMRYYGSFILMMMLLFFCSMENMTDESITASRRLLLEVLSAVIFYACLMFKGLARQSTAEQYILLWYMAIDEWVGKLYPPVYPPVDNRWLVLHPSTIITSILIIIMAVLFYIIYTRRGKSQAKKFFASILIIMALGVNVAAGTIIIYAYKVDPATVREVVSIDKYLADDTESNTIYLTYGKNKERYDRYDRYTGTYINSPRNFYVVRAENLALTSEDSAIKASDIKLTIVRQFAEKPQKILKSVDYILLENSDSAGHKKLLNVEPVKELSGEHFTLYRNLKPDILQFGD